MASKLKSNSYVNPTYKTKGGHPILVSNEIISALSINNNYDLTLKEFLSDYTRIELKTINKKILTNINTVADYEGIFKEYGRPNVE